ncbi:hypothetical protein ACIRVF_00895 [Kitasatospora sp. NPDC101157]|uniref:hypothetical protein n=1 Tax=Kitasatospora sp. NPDC101157 TaxID=3364098 RepID=UPI00381A0F5C
MSEQRQGQEQGQGQGQGEQGQEDRDQGQPKARSGRRPAAGKARLVFRDPLDQQSRDDTDAGWGDRPGAGESGGRGLDWYLSQRPPHHGD